MHMNEPLVNYRWILIPFAVIAMVAGNQYADKQEENCSDAYKQMLRRVASLLGAEVEPNVKWSGIKPLRVPANATLGFRWGRVVAQRPVQLLRWAGSATILGLILVGLRTCRPHRME
jgi:hypothetical protein